MCRAWSGSGSLIRQVDEVGTIRRLLAECLATDQAHVRRATHQSEENVVGEKLSLFRTAVATRAEKPELPAPHPAATVSVPWLGNSFHIFIL